MANIAVADAPLRRVMVVGCAGAGKTTLARRLAHQLGVPAISLDLHFWRPGWQVPGREAWRAQTVALTALPAWVMDGNYSSTFDVRMARAQCLVWLDYPRAT
jgi:adenylate kinase family enzyme